MKRAFVIMILTLGALAFVLAACQMPVPPRPPSGPTATSIFAEYTPQPSVEVPPTDTAPPLQVPTGEAQTTEAPTAEAPTAAATTAAATSVVSPTASAPATVAPTATVTATLPAAATPTATPAPAVSPLATSQAVPTLAPGAVLPSASLPLPAKYTLQRGEFPYCIARRYNVNPYELMRLNSFSFRQFFYAGQVVWLPQTGNPWPVERALHAHTSTYTVQSNRETFYSVACYFGDIDPAALAQANGMDVGAKLQKGQVLTLVP